MTNRRSLLVIGVMALFMAVLSACAPGSPMMADHDVDISIDEAIAGQNAVMAGAMSGNISLSESQASSLLTELLKQNHLNKVEIADISSAMDGDVNTITVNLASPVGGIDSLGVAGTIMSSSGVVSVDLSQAWAGGMGVDPALLGMVSAQINASLAGMPMGLPDGALGIPSDQVAMVSDMLMQMGLNSIEIADVTTQFDGGNIGVMGSLASPVMGVDSLGLSFGLSVDGGMAHVSVGEAFAGNLVADSGITSMVADQINAQLGAIPLPPVAINADGGELMVALGQ
ncbi:MAG: hypothetical protein R2932_07670 [Caldilineaceae bacterium]